MKKLILIVLVFATVSFAQTLKVGDEITPFTLQDQFEKSHMINSTDHRVIIVTFEKEVAEWMTEYLKDKPTEYLANNGAIYISDISGMPFLITKFFAMPKFKEYNYPLVLLNEETDLFPSKEGAITVMTTSEGKVNSIEYISKSDKIGNIFE